MKARPYQAEAVDAIFAFFASHPDPKDNPVLALPTGTGKAFIIAEFMHRVLKWWPGQRIMNLVHVKELVDQNAKTLKRIWPQAPLGVFSAGLGQKVAHMPITFAGVKSVSSNLKLFGKQDIIVIDEAHLVPEKEESDYLRVINYFRALNPNLRLVALSATPYRLGMGRITDGGIFTHTCFDLTSMREFNQLLEDGYLCPLIPIQTQMIINVDGVAKRGGEFISNDLQNAVNKEYITRAALRETMTAAADRKHWLIFGTGVDHVESIAKMLREEFGVSANVVHGSLTNAQRDKNIEDFKSGEVRACVNANVLLTGFDMPHLDCIVCLRPTSSTVLHVQMLGRLTRPCYMPGYDLDTVEGRLDAMAHGPKQKGLVLDFAGNVTRLGPINDPRIPKRGGKGKGEMPVKLCDHCSCLNHISARVCDNCGEPFPIEEKITEKASTAVLIAVEEPPQTEVFVVNTRTVERVTKFGSPDMLKVSYYCGIQRFSEVVCIEHHHSPIIHRARKWWRDHSLPVAEGQELVIPQSTNEAIARQHSLRQPQRIVVWVNKRRNGKLAPEVMSHQFDDPAAPTA